VTLKNKLENELKDALRAADQLKLGTLRLVLSAIKNKEIEAKRELADHEVIKLLNSQAKQRRDSITAFKSGGRDDLVEIEEKELKIISNYLPEELSEGEIETVVQAKIAELSATTKDFGLVMSAVMQQLGAAASGQIVSGIVKRNLK
jgi:uncharacterized protein YqeY